MTTTIDSLLDQGGSGRIRLSLTLGIFPAGEILVTEESYSFVAPQFPDAPRRELELKGKSGKVLARVIASSSHQNRA